MTTSTPAASSFSGAVSARSDLMRQLFITASAVFWVFGTLFGLGILGTRVEESSGGSLAADATLIAPATNAFSVWSVIYVGLFAYLIYQWLPANRSTDRMRAIGWFAGWSMLLNAAWLLVTQRGWLEISVVVMIALVLVLGVLVGRLHTYRGKGWLDALLIDGTFGLYLGWVCVATCANIAATLVARGIPATGVGSTIATVVVLLVVLALAAVLARRVGGRWAVAAGIAWGLSWVAVGRLTDQPRSTAVAVAAIVVALGVVAVNWLARRRQLTSA